MYITYTYGDATGLAELALIIKSGKVTANIQALGERKKQMQVVVYGTSNEEKLGSPSVLLPYDQ